MLASINLNQDVLFDPNEYTWKLIKQDMASVWTNPKELEKRMAEFERDNMTPVHVRGHKTQLASMYLWEFIQTVAPAMYMGNPEGPAVKHNVIFFNLDDMCPIYKENQISKLGEQLAYTIPPHSNVVISTGYEDGDTVKVRFTGSDQVIAGWIKDTKPDECRPADIFDDGEYDFIIQHGNNSIILLNNSDNQASCKLAFGRYLKESPE